MVCFSLICLLKLILYNIKLQNQMCDWKPKMFLFCFTKIVNQAFLHYSHIWLLGFFTFLVALAHDAPPPLPGGAFYSAKIWGQSTLPSATYAPVIFNMMMHEERILDFYVWLSIYNKKVLYLIPTIISWGKNAIFIIIKLKTIGLFFPNILDVFPAMDLVISSVVLAKFSFSNFFEKKPSFLKFYFFTDF